MVAPLFGIDVSRYQGAPDWAKVAESGISFAICRASLGPAYVDPQFARNRAEAERVGLVVGAYHYLTASAPGQADWFVKTVGSFDGLIAVVDVENRGTKIAEVDRFAAEFDKLTNGHPLLIYTGRWFWAGKAFKNPKRSNLGKLWHSRYVSGEWATGKSPAEAYAAVPPSWWKPAYGGWPTVTILQFSSSTKVPGIVSRCDADAFLGTLDELRALAGNTAPTEDRVRLLAAIATLTGYIDTLAAEQARKRTVPGWAKLRAYQLRRRLYVARLRALP